MSVLVPLIFLGVLVAGGCAAPPSAVTVVASSSTKTSTVQRPSTIVVPGGQTSLKAPQSLSSVHPAASSVASASASTTVNKTNTTSTTLDPKKPPTVHCPVTGQRPMTAVAGQAITLPCRAPANTSVVAVTWTRRDLKAKNVLLFQDGKTVPDNQHPSYRNRVSLKDRLLRSGELSVVLKDVKVEDAGVYECRFKERKGRLITVSEVVSSVSLAVPPTDDPSEDSKRHRTALTVTLSVIGVIVVFAVFVAIVVAICRTCRRCAGQH